MRLTDFFSVFKLPRVTIDLMLDRAAANDPFYGRLTRDFHRQAVSPHPKFFFIPRYRHGFAVCPLPRTFEEYFKLLEPAAHRNYRKALRLGYAVGRLDFNARIEEVRGIHRSTPVRQGELPAFIREGRIMPNADPPSRTPDHDYPYYGVFKDDKLWAYASCLVAGELCNLCDVYGHASRQADGVVPLLLIEMARDLIRSRPTVKYFTYDTFFGAGQTLRRFKRKFHFLPHRVSWVLGERRASAAPSEGAMVRSVALTDPR